MATDIEGGAIMLDEALGGDTLCGVAEDTVDGAITAGEALSLSMMVSSLWVMSSNVSAMRRSMTVGKVLVENTLGGVAIG